MQDLVNQYAKLLKTKVMASREDGETIIFVLASGPKFRMTKTELHEAIAEIQKQSKADAAEEESAVPPRPKSKRKEK